MLMFDMKGGYAIPRVLLLSVINAQIPTELTESQESVYVMSACSKIISGLCKYFIV